MCGIVGYWDKKGTCSEGLGKTVLKMLEALGCRGPDSAGVALFGAGEERQMVLRVKLGEAQGTGTNGAFAQKGEQVAARVQAVGKVRQALTTAEYLRLVVDYQGDPGELERLVEGGNPEVEVVSMGRHLEIVKQVGSPQNLNATYGVECFSGTHGLGHTRLSTESRIDLSHSQPFWAHGRPDMAVVHNGHITNYHKLRRRYEQRGLRFYTENDSEIIGMYLRGRLEQGMDLQQAMQASLADLDGSFSYLVATAQALGFARDPFALKPLLFAETEDFAAMATEEIALRAALAGEYEAAETRAGEVRLWHR
jgi:glutamate synthase domain-containing protein 1